MVRGWLEEFSVKPAVAVSGAAPCAGVGDVKDCKDR